MGYHYSLIKKKWENMKRDLSEFSIFDVAEVAKHFENHIAEQDIIVTNLRKKITLLTYALSVNIIFLVFLMVVLISVIK